MGSLMAGVVLDLCVACNTTRASHEVMSSQNVALTETLTDSLLSDSRSGTSFSIGDTANVRVCDGGTVRIERDDQGRPILYSWERNVDYDLARVLYESAEFFEKMNRISVSRTFVSEDSSTRDAETDTSTEIGPNPCRLVGEAITIAVVLAIAVQVCKRMGILK